MFMTPPNASTGLSFSIALVRQEGASGERKRGREREGRKGRDRV
jgi:hypothetical protein